VGYSDELGRSFELFKETGKIKTISVQPLNLHLQKGRGDRAVRGKMVHGATGTHFSFQATTWALVSVMAAVGKRGEEEHSINY